MEDLFVRHGAKPPGAFSILKFYNMFCIICQSLSDAQKHTCTRVLCSICFSKILAFFLLLSNSLYLPLVPSPSLGFCCCQSPGVIAKESDGNSASLHSCSLLASILFSILAISRYSILLFRNNKSYLAIGL